MTAESSAITNSQPVSVCPAVSVWLGLMVLVVECPFFPGTPGAELGLLGDQAPASGQMAISLILALWALWGGCPRQDHPPNTHTHTHTHTPLVGHTFSGACGWIQAEHVPRGTRSRTS